MIKATLHSIEDLYEWWQSHDLAYWTLYRDQSEQKQASKVIARNSKTSSKEGAWDMLKGSIEMQSKHGGKFTILAVPKSNGNAGMTTFLTLENKTAANSSINGTSSSVGIYGNDVIEAAIEKARAEERRLNELEFRLEKAEAARDAQFASVGFWERIADAAIEDPESFGKSVAQIGNVIVGGLAMLTGKIPTAPTAPSSPPGVNQSPPATSPTPSAEVPQLSDASDAALTAIEQHFDLDEVLPKLARLIKSNPDYAQNLLNQID